MNDFDNMVLLQITGDNVDFDAISTSLSLKPTHCCRNGQPYPGLDGLVPPFTEDVWIYEPFPDNSKSIQESIDHLWTLLKPKKPYLLQLSKAYMYGIVIIIKPLRLIGLHTLQPSSLDIFRELNICLNIVIANNKLQA